MSIKKINLDSNLNSATICFTRNNQLSFKKPSFVEYVSTVALTISWRLNIIDTYKVPLIYGMCDNMDDMWHYVVSPGSAWWPDVAVEPWNSPDVSRAIEAQYWILTWCPGDVCSGFLLVCWASLLGVPSDFKWQGYIWMVITVEFRRNSMSSVFDIWPWIQ